MVYRGHLTFQNTQNVLGPRSFWPVHGANQPLVKLELQHTITFDKAQIIQILCLQNTVMVDKLETAIGCAEGSVQCVVKSNRTTIFVFFSRLVFFFYLRVGAHLEVMIMTTTTTMTSPKSKDENNLVFWNGCKGYMCPMTCIDIKIERTRSICLERKGEI